MTGRFDLAPTPLAGLMVVDRRPVGDERGWLERLFCTADLADLLSGRAIEQVNRTLTRQAGSVRGMHYQVPPSAEAKIVSCLRGRIFDVAVDLRHGSPTFLQWHAEMLEGSGHRSLYVPEGFAHGFQALAPDCEVLYLHTARYDPAAERGVHPLDPGVGIAWPLPVEQLSARDARHPMLDGRFEGVRA